MLYKRPTTKKERQQLKSLLNDKTRELMTIIDLWREENNFKISGHLTLRELTTNWRVEINITEEVEH